MKRTPWFPLDAQFQDDDRILEISAEAELLYVRAAAKCKALATGGIVTTARLRALCDKLTGDRHALAAELVDAGLWANATGGWLVSAYSSWNGSADEAVRESSANGKRGNHARWEHEGPFEDCSICHPDPGVAPDSPPDRPPTRPDEGSPPDRKGDRPPIAPRCDDVSPGESGASRPPDRRRDETIQDEDKTPPPPTANPRPDADEPVAVVVSTKLLELIGVTRPEPDRGEVARAEHLLAGGWPAKALEALALDVAAMPDHEIETSRRNVLRGLLDKRLTQPAPTDQRPGPARADTPRPILDDERKPCDDCAASGWIDAPEGGVTHCPACHPLGGTP